MLVGVLGGGQLGRMLALAGIPLGMRFRFLDPAPEAPAGAVGELVVGAYDDEGALKELAEGATVLTYEFENVPVAAARSLAERVTVLPPPEALEAAQDRVAEKRLFARLGIPAAPWAPVGGPEELPAALAAVGAPALLKTRRLGYDGKGQAPVERPSDAGSAWEAVGRSPSILEARVGFDRELSVLAVRGRDGEVRAYPLVENVHREGILRVSRAPAPGLTSDLQARAEGFARRVLEELGYVGVLAIELFQVGEQLLANEMAPRVHNSGHWTIEGALTSQFENHLRAVAGLPLGPTDPRGCSAMVNLIGATPRPAEVLAVPGAHLHLYGKAPRPGRKLGHVTVVAEDEGTLEARLAEVRPAVERAAG
ncbi:MAG TPA: 5-(carboxyamino)imidazole ribonucleotide synthase [Actinomycetota bacterium]|nr:5-(carboxyamino)imidazole ribonucleotide synthase [Actinomycetota bacterium]